jgi:hypothetical protein
VGEVGDSRYPQVAQVLGSAVRVVSEILRWDIPIWFPKFKFEKCFMFNAEKDTEKLIVQGLFLKELEGQETRFPSIQYV